MRTFFTLLFTGTALGVSAQTVSTFDNNPLSAGTHWDGSDLSGSFISGNALFPNDYDTTWGYWLGGWAYSNETDTTLTTASTAHQFCSRAGGGYNWSPNFGVGTQGSVLYLTGNAAGKALGGLYVTNTTYDFNSMKLGDAFAKQFGGATGNDPDFFKLTIKKFLGGSLGPDSVEFYLADYRFSNNAQDYIVKTWEFVNLTSLGNCDSLLFILSSSDVGSFGMNTPAFFCIDNLITMDSPAYTEAIAENTLRAFPTVTNHFITLQQKNYDNAEVVVYSPGGEILMQQDFSSLQFNLDVSALSRGMYLLQMKSGGQTLTRKFIKE